MQKILDWNKIYNTGQTYSGKANIKAGNNILCVSPIRENSYDNALNYLDKDGFVVEELPLGEHLKEPKSYQLLDFDQIRRLKTFYDTANKSGNSL